MTTNNATSGAAAENPEPCWTVILTTFPEITVTAYESCGDHCVEYSRWPEDLIAAGVMTVGWKTPTRKHLRDPDGGKVSISRRWRLAGQENPRRYCTVERWRTFAELRRLPGACEAFEAHEKWEAWSAARWASRCAPQPAPTPPRPNT